MDNQILAVFCTGEKTLRLASETAGGPEGRVAVIESRIEKINKE